MADLTEHQLRTAEALGREILQTEPRAIAAHFDGAAGLMAGRRQSTGSAPKSGVSRRRNRRRQVVGSRKIPVIRRRASSPGLR